MQTAHAKSFQTTTMHKGTHINLYTEKNVRNKSHPLFRNDWFWVVRFE